MARKIKTLDEAPVDIIEAVKRGFIHRGFIPRKYRRNSQLEDSHTESDENRSDSKNNKPESPKGGQKDSVSSSGRRKTSGKIEAKNPDIALIDSQPGSQEAAKDPGEPEPGEVHEKLIDITEKAQDILFTADTVFPFATFPSTITLDREKLTVVERFFFKVAKVITVPISSMISADTNVGPFFGSVHMTSKYFVDNTHSVNFLWRHDAEEIHRLLQGFIIANEKGLDVSDVEMEDLKVLLEDLGHGTKE